jgi:hypothetical protein
MEVKKTSKHSVRVFFGPYYVTAYKMAATRNMWSITVYEEIPSIFGSHSTIMTENGKVYGAVNSHCLNKFDHLPVGEERSMAVAEGYAKAYAKAYSLAFAVFPSLLIDATVSFHDGRIDIYSEEFRHTVAENLDENSANNSWEKCFAYAAAKYADVLYGDGKYPRINELMQGYNKRTAETAKLMKKIGHNV